MALRSKPNRQNPRTKFSRLNTHSGATHRSACPAHTGCCACCWCWCWVVHWVHLGHCRAALGSVAGDLTSTGTGAGSFAPPPYRLLPAEGWGRACSRLISWAWATAPSTGFGNGAAPRCWHYCVYPDRPCSGPSPCPCLVFKTNAQPSFTLHMPIGFQNLARSCADSDRRSSANLDPVCRVLLWQAPAGRGRLAGAAGGGSWQRLISRI